MKTSLLCGLSNHVGNIKLVFVVTIATKLTGLIR